MSSAGTDRLVTAVAAVTLAIGASLAGAPRRTATALGLGDHPRFSRTVGVIDLALVPGLVRGRPRWPWMAGRAVLNLVIAGHYRRESRRTGARGRARAGAVAMTALTLTDGALALALRASDRARQV